MLMEIYVTIALTQYHMTTVQMIHLGVESATRQHLVLPQLEPPPQHQRLLQFQLHGQGHGLGPNLIQIRNQIRGQSRLVMMVGYVGYFRAHSDVLVESLGLGDESE